MRKTSNESGGTFAKARLGGTFIESMMAATDTHTIVVSAEQLQTCTEHPNWGQGAQVMVVR